MSSTSSGRQLLSYLNQRLPPIFLALAIATFILGIARAIESRELISSIPRQLASILYFHIVSFALLWAIWRRPMSIQRLVLLSIVAVSDFVAWTLVSMFDGRAFDTSFYRPIILNLAVHRSMFLTVGAILLILATRVQNVAIVHESTSESAWSWKMLAMRFSILDMLLIITLIATVHFAWQNLPFLVANGDVAMEVNFAQTAYTGIASALRTFVAWLVVAMMLHGSKLSTTRIVFAGILLQCIAIGLADLERELKPLLLDYWTNSLGLMHELSSPADRFGEGRDVTLYSIFSSTLVLLTALLVRYFDYHFAFSNRPR